ncbi:MAG: hypothetical protein GIW99_04500 [Candidatus Eremiobacteraeota bacterium]|nr:hypothetical protein [Candidatus Eremiobacteraeota bacterium]MBC5826931.1 hypothetical protein [Candidatus Eremiobacteraeota bacterium]
MTRQAAQRGIAIVAVLLASALLLGLLAVMVDIGTAQLRRVTEQVRGLQASAAADAGTGLLRSWLARDGGDPKRMEADLAAANGELVENIDADTSVTVRIEVLPVLSVFPDDHIDHLLQSDPKIQERPLQIVSDATVAVGGVAMATRSTTTLLRVFRGARPYSEIVGAIDSQAPVGVESPGDAGGQAGSASLSDLLIHAYRQHKGILTENRSAFKDDRWSDGNAPSNGGLP